MYILPYIKRELPFGPQIWLFLERNGTHLIEEDDAHSFAVENGLAHTPVFIERDDIRYLEVKPDHPGLDQFYSWGDIVPGMIPAKEVWRPFLWLEGSQLDIPLSRTHTVHSVSNTILSLNTINTR